MTRKYKNPPIREAVCEFRFSPEMTWDMTIPGLLFERIRDKYPEKRQRLLSSAELFQEESSIGQRLTQEPRLLFYDKGGTRLVQVGDHLLTVNTLAPYCGWDEDFLPRIAFVLDALSQILTPSHFLRTGLRYINAIDISGSRVELEDYFSFRPFMGPALPQDHTSFMIGCQFPFEPQQSLCKVVLTNTEASREGALGFLLDLDLYSAVPNVVPVPEVHEWLSWAHEKVNGIFEGCITDALREQFGEVT